MKYNTEQILQSYSIPELREIVKIHNKSVMDFIKDEIKMIREKFKEQKLIKITGLKDKMEIINIMMEKKNHFRNIPFKKPLTTPEKKEYMKNDVQPALNKIFREWDRDGDKDEVVDGINLLYSEMKRKDVKLPLTKAKLIKEIFASERKPNRPSQPPLFAYVDGKLQRITVLEAKKLRPAKPTRASTIQPQLKVHEMPDGEVMVGEDHTKDSKPLITLDVKDKPKKKIKKKIKIRTVEEREAKEAKEEKFQN